MNNVDNFKEFVKRNPRLISYVKNSSMSWQSFYELYDLYGEDDNIWNDYLKEDELVSDQATNISNNKTTTNTIGWSDLLDMAKNIDVDKMQTGISSLQKAIGLFSELFLSKDTPTSSESTYEPRPVYQRFDD